jgi:hypothetical protein
VTSIRKVIRKYILRGGEEENKAGFSYTVYWTDLVGGWSEERRNIARLAVERIVEQPDFKPNEYQHLYHLSEVDEVAHVGSSLLALLKVLQAYDEGEGAGKET